MAHLVALGPQEVGKEFPLDGGECLLGRRLDCHVCIPDQRVSRRHARIRAEGHEGWQLEDLGSCNGTFVNGRRVQGSMRLRHGDEIEIGASRFRMDLADEAVAAMEAAPVLTTEAEGAVTMFELSPLGLSLKPDAHRGDRAPSQRDIDRLQRKLQAMYKISETVASGLDGQTLLDRVTAVLLEVLPQATAAAAVTVDPRSQQLRTQAAKRRRGGDADAGAMNISQAVVDRVLRQGQSVLLRAPTDLSLGVPVDTMVIKNPLQAPMGDGPLPPPGEGAVGWRMGAPLTFRGEHFGILHVEAESALGYFTQDDLDLLGGVAAQAGVALHLIGLHQRLMARERFDYDLRLARQIQRNLLPRDPPRVQGIDFAVHYEPAFHVGGDFYDFLWQDPTRLSMVVGDVSGKAISGALFMARVTSEIRASGPIEASPSRVVQRVNRALSEVAEDGMFTTMVYLSLDLTQNVVRYANAGHTTPLIRRADGSVEELEFDESRCMPVGVLAKIEVGETVVELHAGDVLVLYTDGIIEACSTAGEFYGHQRLVEVLRGAPGGAREILDLVLADLDRFVGEAPQADDQTVVCLSVSGATSVRYDSALPPDLPPDRL